MKNIIKRVLLLSALVALTACSNAQSSQDNNESKPQAETTQLTEAPSSDSSESKPTSSEDDDREIRENELYTDSGLSIKFKATGASIDKVTFNNKQVAKDGFVVGRCANRIANGKFSIKGTQYSVSVNSGSHSLHGGQGQGMNGWRGPFATKDWTKVSQTASTITYTIHSADGENGYPGNMDMTVKYTLSQAGELLIEYSATSDKDTLCNPTNHLFMAPNSNNSYNDIKLWIDADNYTPLNNQIPTGEISPVAGTQFDYTTEKAFDGSRSYDDNLVLNGTGYRKVATMTGTSLGLKIDVFTDRPGLQLYKDGSGSICLETQMFPDAINQANFEDPILEAGQEFYSKTAYVFSSAE